jgi:uncharacterized protein (TIGR03118 family)
MNADAMTQKPQSSRRLSKVLMRMRALATIIAVLPVANVAVPAAKADPTAYLAADLVSDHPGVAPITDPHLVNAWGIALSSSSPFWVSSEGIGVSNLYAGDVTTPLIKLALEVSIPGGHPTGQVFNVTISNVTPDFVVSNGTSSGPAIFIFASLSGKVTGWNPNVPPQSTEAQLAYTGAGSVYTGIALANNGGGNFLYLADFQNGKIDVLNRTFQLQPAGAFPFTDPGLPSDYAPFNVAAIGGKIYVAYAKRDASGDEVTGAHLGFIDVFDASGNFEKRLVSKGALNAPWAMVVAPAGFGDFSGDLLVGNFGDGRINAFDPTTGTYLGTLSQSPDHPLEIDGLWGLKFGNGGNGGSTTTLYYAAGPDDETHGLFGKITANPAGTNQVQATLTNGILLINGSRNDDHIDVSLSNNGQEILVFSDNEQIGSFDLASVSRIEFNGWAGDDHIAIVKEITLPTILNGGAGNDTLSGGGGTNILLGGPGDDDLRGSTNRDILIGGDGSDRLQAGSNDDLLIGGATKYDNNVPALLQILGEWTSANSYHMRIANLSSGAGGLPILDSTTVFDDGAVDTLRGNQDLDWFFAGSNDKLPDRQPAEQVN